VTLRGRYSKIRKKSVSNYYILNLAAADELLLCTLPLYCVSTYTSDWVFGEVVCKLAYVFRESNKYTGILTLVALSVDRCLATYHDSTPLRRVPVGVAVCAVVWLVAVGATLPYAVHATVTPAAAPLDARRRTCRLVWRLTTAARRAWTYSQLALGLVAPLAVIAGANAVLLWRLRRRSSSRRSTTSQSRRRTDAAAAAAAADRRNSSRRRASSLALAATTKLVSHVFRHLFTRKKRRILFNDVSTASITLHYIRNYLLWPKSKSNFKNHYGDAVI